MSLIKQMSIEQLSYMISVCLKDSRPDKAKPYIDEFKSRGPRCAKFAERYKNA